MKENWKERSKKLLTISWGKSRGQKKVIYLSNANFEYVTVLDGRSKDKIKYPSGRLFLRPDREPEKTPGTRGDAPGVFEFKSFLEKYEARPKS